MVQGRDADIFTDLPLHGCCARATWWRQVVAVAVAVLSSPLRALLHRWGRYGMSWGRGGAPFPGVTFSQNQRHWTDNATPMPIHPPLTGTNTNPGGRNPSGDQLLVPHALPQGPPGFFDCKHYSGRGAAPPDTRLPRRPTWACSGSCSSSALGASSMRAS